MFDDAGDPRLAGPSQGGSEEPPPDNDGQQNSASSTQPDMDREQLALLKRIGREIKADKKHFKKRFERMHADMEVARTGRPKGWPEGNYTANIIGRHIRQKTSSLYAKNPKAVSRRRETLDFKLWDENQSSLMLAIETLQQAVQAGQQAQQMASGAVPSIDPSGMPVPTPQLPTGYEQAKAVIADFQAGMQNRETIKKIGRTLEILFSHSIREQKPLDFKAGMKRVVRRACTTSVGYVEIGFQRQMGPRLGLNEQLADAQERLAHLKRLAEDQSDPENCDDDEEEKGELENMIKALQEEPGTVLREGLVYDYPLSTRVIPHRACRQLVGFVGASHVTVEYLYTPDQAEEIFGVKVPKFTEYSADGKKAADDEPELPLHRSDDGDPNSDYAGGSSKANSFMLVWKHYDKPSGLVYYLCDGCDFWLRTPAPPDVYVDDFWPLYALTFNEVESEKEIFPPSDVELLDDMQREYNRSREGKRQHRKAAIPRFLFANGTFDDDDVDALSKAEPFSATGLNVPPETDIAKILVNVPVPGVDPNLYDVNEIMTDMQYIVGSQQAQMGATSKSTATESAIAASASASTDASSVDELDAFLTLIARASGQVLMGNMTEEQVMQVVGPGAVWPQQSLQDIADALFLEIEAGSTGKPNQAIEIQNWTNMLPFLLQMPGIDKVWLARETLRRLDDKMDLTEAITSEVPSIVAQNRSAAAGVPPAGAPGPGVSGGPPTPPPGPQGGPPGAPEDQGPQGAHNGPPPPAALKPGSKPAFGSNQV